jgi:hypothetical protein
LKLLGELFFGHGVGVGVGLEGEPPVAQEFEDMAPMDWKDRFCKATKRKEKKSKQPGFSCHIQHGFPENSHDRQLKRGNSRYGNSHLP